jgi:Tfp pilus assembly PilM family ATPase/Tfp pilus assembly protein PilN
MYTALNIGSASLKIIAVKGRQVKRWGSLPLEAGLVRDGLVLQPEAVGATIDALFKDSKIPKENVITSLTGLSFTSRFLTMPRLKPALLEEAIRRAARKEIPLPLDELYLSWQPVGSQRDETTFFVVGVPRNLIDTLVQTLAAARLEPYLMDLRPLALARAANRVQAIIASLEPDCFDIVLVADGVPAIMHTISPRGEGATLEDNIRRLADEISRTTGFYQNTHPESRLSQETPLLLTGELATEAATIGIVQTEIEYPVAVLVPPLEFPSDFPVALYAANAGLALKKIPPKKTAKGQEASFYDININLLSSKYRKARARPLPPGHLLLTVFLIMAIGLLFPIYQARSRLDADTRQLQGELNRVNREINLATLAAEEDTQTEATIQAMTDSTQAIKNRLQSLLRPRGGIGSRLVSVTGALPPQAYFTSVAIENNQITVRGETDSPFTVVSYATALEAIETFAEVRIKSLDAVVSTPAGVTGDGEAPAASQTIAFSIIIKED